MTRQDLFYALGIVLVSVLLLANLLRPGAPQAYDYPLPGTPVAIAAAGDDSAWALIGNRVYYVSFRTRAELRKDIIYVIDNEDLQ